MSTDAKDLRKEIEELKAARAAQAATQTGGMATAGAMQAGTIAAVAAGAVGLVVGIFIGIAATQNAQPNGGWRR